MSIANLILFSAVFLIVLLFSMYWLLKRYTGSILERSMSVFTDKVFEKVTSLYEQRFKNEKEEIHRDLENKRVLMQEMVQKLENKLINAEKERTASFSTLKESIREQVEQVHRLTSTTEALGKVLSNNQLRGKFGEQVAENLLKMAGFVKGLDYIINTRQKTESTRPDFSLFLPDKTKVNVDAKFPYQNLKKAAETNKKEEKKRYLLLFKNDVREKIKQVAGREYINPKENTVDFVILFIPNEAIFSYIYEQLSDVWEEAMRKKVIMTGPFSFTAILRMVKQAYDNFRFQQNVQEIIALIKRFHLEFQKYSEEFEKIDVYIKRLQEQFNKVRTTRSNQLEQVVNKIMLSGETSKQQKVFEK